MWINAVLTLLGISGEALKSRAALKKAQIETKAEAVRRMADNEAAWESMAGQNAANSFLDELWTFVLLVPLVLAFTGHQSRVEEGFDALQGVPDWYVWAVLASVGWAFARRGVPAVSAWVRKK